MRGAESAWRTRLRRHRRPLRVMLVLALLSLLLTWVGRHAGTVAMPLACRIYG
jgi:hypothetical protein